MFCGCPWRQSLGKCCCAQASQHSVGVVGSGGGKATGFLTPVTFSRSVIWQQASQSSSISLVTLADAWIWMDVEAFPSINDSLNGPGWWEGIRYSRRGDTLFCIIFVSIRKRLVRVNYHHHGSVRLDDIKADRKSRLH